MRLLRLWPLLMLSIGCSEDPQSSKGGADDASTDQRSDGATDAAADRGAAEDGPSVPNDAGGDAGSAKRGIDVLTQHNDSARTGANLAETILNATNVGSPAFQKLFARPVDDQIYAQPLIVSDIEMPEHGMRNVVYVATVNNSVYAFDADAPERTEPLWHRSLMPSDARPILNTDMVGPTNQTSACFGRYRDFSGHIGIVGTPVIDRATHTLYVVARSMEDGQAVQRFHALDIRDGSDLPNSPVTIAPTAAGSGDGGDGSTVVFDSLRENQRSALLLLNGVVYVGWAGHCDWQPYHGWLVGYDAATLQQRIVYNVTPDGNAGGIWQSGQGPSTDGTYVYLVTGNGTRGIEGNLRATRNRGMSFLKLEPSGGTLEVVSWFMPYNHSYLEVRDLDLGSAGMLLIPGTRLAVSGGKGGWMYVVDRDNMGGLTDSTSRDDNVVQTFNLNDPNHLHGSPVYWNGPDGGRVYVMAEEDYLKSFPVLEESYEPDSKVLDTDNVQQSSMRAPSDVDQGNLLMPGGILSLSANGSTRGTGIVWANLNSSGDANQMVQPGVLRAFDASDVSVELYNNLENEARDSCGDFAKFSYPTIANGKVYLASFSNQLCVYGLQSENP